MHITAFKIALSVKWFSRSLLYCMPRTLDSPNGIPCPSCHRPCWPASSFALWIWILWKLVNSGHMQNLCCGGLLTFVLGNQVVKMKIINDDGVTRPSLHVCRWESIMEEGQKDCSSKSPRNAGGTQCLLDMTTMWQGWCIHETSAT